MFVHILLLKRSKHARVLWLSDLLSLLGDWFLIIAIITLVKQTCNKALAISILMAVEFLPPIIMSPLIGWVVDRYSRRDILVIVNIVMTIIALMFIPVGLFVSLPILKLVLIYLLYMGIHTMAAFEESATAAYLPYVIKDEADLYTMNSILHMMWGLMLAIGGVTAGYFVAYVGLYYAFVIDAITFIIAIVMILSLPKDPSVPSALSHSSSIMEYYKVTIKGLFSQRQYETMMFVKPLWAIGGGIVLLAFNKIGDHMLSLDELALGYVYMSRGLGNFLGTYFGRLWYKPSVNFVLKYTIAVLALSSLLAVIMGFSSVFVVILILVLGFELLASNIWYFVYNFWQKEIKSDELGSIYSIDEALTMLALSISSIIGGLLFDYLGLRYTLMVAALFMILSSFVLFAFKKWLIRS